MARLTHDNLARARALIALYPQKRSALVPILHVLQEQDGFLSPDGIEHVAELLELTSAEVRGTASFYDMFHLEPIGRHLVAVCTNIACMLAGSGELLEHIEDTLGIKAGATTKDGEFTLEDAECLALCGNGPCLTVNWRYFGDMTPKGWDALAADLRNGRLSDEVPPHGALCRVQRSVGLPASAGGPGPDGADQVGGSLQADGVALSAEGEVVQLATSRTTPAVAGSPRDASGPRDTSDRSRGVRRAAGDGTSTQGPVRQAPGKRGAGK